MGGGRVFSGGLGNGNASSLNVLLQKQNIPCTPDPLDALFLSGSSSSFLGSKSMVSFGDVQGGKGGNRLFFLPFDDDDIDRNGDDDMAEYLLHQPEQKRRLTAEQVKFLGKSFEVENKLEPERKVQLAKDLGLQPRQVAIWYQNRRARWKTKQLEKDYESLQARYTNLKANYENLLKDKEKLKSEVANLTEKVLLREEEQMGNFKHSETEKFQEPPQKCLFDSSASEGERSKVSIGDISSAKSDINIFDSDGGHSSLLEHCDQSDLSQDEEDNQSKSLFPAFIFPKLEDVDCSDPPETPCHFGYTVEDHTFWSWSY